MTETTALPEHAARLDAEAEHLTTPCGAGRMVWRRWGRGDPVVLAHGGSGSWTHWIRTIPALRPHYELWAADLPGLGGSAMPDPPLTPASCGRVLAAGLRALIPRERRAHVVAFSFGAHVSTLALGELGDHVAGFTITGCSALGLREAKDMPGLPKERSGMGADDKREVHRRVLATLMFADASQIDEEAVALQAENVRQARFRSREFALTDEVRRGLAHVKMPLSAIWGGRDAVARPNVAKVLEVVGEHHPELVAHVIPDAGHWVMYEAADAYNAALLDVLARRRQA